VRRILIGLGVAILLAAIGVTPTIAGVATWKFVLAAFGVALFILAERQTGGRG